MLSVSTSQSGQVCVLSVDIIQVYVSERYTAYLYYSDSQYQTGMRIVCQYLKCQYQTYSGQVCVLFVSIRQFLDRYVYCLSV